MKRALWLTLAFCVSSHAHDQQSDAEANRPMNLDQLLTAFGWDLDRVHIRRQQVSDRLWVLFGAGGNIGVSVGPQGVLIVDDQFPELVPKIADAIREIGGGAVDFAVNTHWHFDHAEGNLALGPGGTWLVSQANSRDMMLEDHIINLVAVKYEQKAYPKSALPVITYDNTMQFHFNDELIELIHVGPAHTTGDTVVIFRESNAVHLGDVFNRGYPFIDADNGGDLSGMINFCEAVLNSIDEQTTVIPGHGEISDYQGLVAYIDMLKDVRKTISRMIKRGRTLSQVVEAKPTAQYDAEYGDPSNFVNRAYTSLKREYSR